MAKIKLIRTPRRFRGAIAWDVEYTLVAWDVEHTVGFVHKATTGRLWMNSNESGTYYGTRKQAVAGLLESRGLKG